jgi:transcriptional regulator CtsR
LSNSGNKKNGFNVELKRRKGKTRRIQRLELNKERHLNGKICAQFEKDV